MSISKFSGHNWAEPEQRKHEGFVICSTLGCISEISPLMSPHHQLRVEHRADSFLGAYLPDSVAMRL